jgi:hypothetical protein
VEWEKTTEIFVSTSSISFCVVISGGDRRGDEGECASKEIIVKDSRMRHSWIAARNGHGEKTEMC